MWNPFRRQRGLDFDNISRYQSSAAKLAAHDQVHAAEPITYQLPGAPPSGRSVRDSVGRVWKRDERIANESLYGQWGSWTEIDTDDGSVSLLDNRVAWTMLLQYGPLTLLDLTEQEWEDARIYGPPGARWGNPAEPCPFVGRPNLNAKLDVPMDLRNCKLGVGHIGVHTDCEGYTLYGDGAATDVKVDPCNCGRPGRHQPGCPRYELTAGGQ